MSSNIIKKSLRPNALLAVALPLGLVGCSGGGGVVSSSAISDSSTSDSSTSDSSTSDSSTSDSSALLSESRTVEGSVLLGPVQYASVFLDTNRNGEFDTGEAEDITDSNGDFVFDTRVASPQFVAHLDGLLSMNHSSGVVAGEMTLVSAPGQTVVSPITTLIAESGQDGDTVADAINLDISNLESFDPFGANSSSTDSLPYLKTSHQISVVHDALFAAVTGAGYAADDASTKIMGAIATTMTASGLDFAGAAQTTIADIVDSVDITQFRAAISADPGLEAALISATKNLIDDIQGLSQLDDFLASSNQGKATLSSSQLLADQVFDAFDGSDDALITFTNAETLETANDNAPISDLGFLNDLGGANESLENKIKVAENSSGSGLKFLLGAEDGGTIDDEGYVWSLLDIDGTDNALFQLTVDNNSGSGGGDRYFLELKSSPDYEDPTNPDHIYRVAMSATDAGGKTVAELLVIEVTNVAEVV